MANSHGIGVKRNDYRRKNRKENKGHRWRGARTVPAIRLIKPTEQSPVITRTAYEDKGFLENVDVTMAEEEYDDMKSVRSTLAYDALIFYPPFLGHNEIRQRRFAETLYKGEYRRTDNAVEMNDRWWEWEEERGLEHAELRIAGLEPLHENTAPRQPTAIGNRAKDFDNICTKCHYQWKGIEFPSRCPACAARLNMSRRPRDRGWDQ